MPHTKATTNNYKLNYHKNGTHRIVADALKNHDNILDVGCNDGYLKLLLPEKTIDGIDYTEYLTNSARKNGYRKALTADLNSSIDFKTELNPPYQCLLFIDVLEHLLDPAGVLKNFVSNLADENSIIIVSLPNVAHITIRLKLALGNFDYTESGILDKTHLHLYTLKTARDLVTRSGLSVSKEIFSSDRFGGIIKRLPFLKTFLGYNIILLCKKL